MKPWTWSVATYFYKKSTSSENVFEMKLNMKKRDLLWDNLRYKQNKLQNILHNHSCSQLLSKHFSLNIVS